MSDGTYHVLPARPEDIAGILALQDENLLENGGLLSVRLTAEWFTKAIAEHFIMAARREGELIAYAVGTPLSWQSHIPIIQDMMRAFPVPDDCYVYGPVCIMAAHRGRGLAQQMLSATHAGMCGKPCRTFVRDDNVISRRAAIKSGMRELGSFRSGTTDYIAIGFD
jgi:hypothetical protein